MVDGIRSVYHLPFPVYLTLCALRLALCVKGQPKAGSFGFGLFTILAAQRPPRECIDGHRLKSQRNEHLFL